MNVAGWADQQLAKWGEFTALVCGPEEYGNAELHEHSCRLASGLLHWGLKPGQVVVLALPPGRLLLDLFAAVLRAGGVVVVSDPLAPEQQRQRLLAEVEPSLLVSDNWKGAMQAAEALSLSEGQPGLVEPIARSSGDPAQIVYTSGTTQSPRASVWTHGVVAERYAPFLDRRQARAPARRALCVLPLWSAFGTQYLYLRWLQKMELVLCSRFEPNSVLETLQQRRVQTCMLVPSMAQGLVAAPGNYDLSSLKSVLLGGSWVSPDLLQRFHQRFGVRAEVVYGLTELGPISRSNGGAGLSGGDGVQVRVVDAQGLPLPPHEVGEVEILAPGRQATYLTDGPRVGESTADRASSGWFRTADLGLLDDEGRLHLKGRSSDTIVCGGAKIYPAEVEEFLLQQSELAEAAVVAVDDSWLGQQAVIWAVLAEQAIIDDAELLGRCRLRFDRLRLPTRVLFRASLPRNSAGKVERERLRNEALEELQAERSCELAQTMTRLSASSRKQQLQACVQELLHRLLGWQDPPFDRPLAELGLDSLGAVQLSQALSARLGRPLPTTLLFDYPTIDALGQHLAQLLQPSSEPRSERPASRPQAGTKLQRAALEPVAIVGVGCRLPSGIHTAEEFWAFCREGRCAVADIERWELDSLYAPGPPQPGKMNSRRAALVDIDRFDADFFGLTTREARSLDPQQRLVLESSWSALEQAGLSAGGASCGLYLGISANEYESSNPLGVSPAMAAGRVSHLLNLRGPSMAIDTSCSSSLVAIHTAITALRTGQCHWALAGGVNAICSPQSWVALSQLGVLAPDGICKAFDASADGFGRGEGCVMFALRPLSDARAANDNVLAVLLGGAVNHDGRASSLTAPRGPAQSQVLFAALSDAGVTADEVGYFEAHGSGTPLGDPIELRAALQVLSDNDRRLLVGTAKANVGHLEAAAGAVGLLRAALMVSRGTVLPQPHFKQLNPALKDLQDRFCIAGEPVPLELRTAAVMSLGMSGTNACLLVAEGPSVARERVVSETPEVLCLSAPEQGVLSCQTEALEAYLAQTKERAEDICFSSSVGRRHFSHRLALVGKDGSQLSEALRAHRGGPSRHGSGLAFLFSGQGSLYEGAGRELYQSEPVFRRAWDSCVEMHPPLSDWMVNDLNRQLEQPALVALQWSLAQLWQHWGLEPRWVMGHSLGEYSAAVVAGVLSLEQALPLVAARARLMADCGGVMVALKAEPDSVLAALADTEVSLAAFNGPGRCVISGEEVEVGRVVAEIGCQALRLPVTSAFHSALMQPVMPAFRQQLSKIHWNSPAIEMVSTVSGQEVADEICQPDFWLRGLRGPVRFASAVNTLVDAGCKQFLELGSGVLASLGPQCAEVEGLTWSSALLSQNPEVQQSRQALAQLFEAGCDPDWASVHAGKGRRRVVLPGYPFQRRSYWSGPWRPKDSRAATPAQSRVAGSSPGRMTGVSVDPDEVAALVASVLGRPVDPEQDLLQAGLDSLRMLNLLSLLRSRWGLHCQPQQFLSQPTVRGLQLLLAGAGSATWGRELMALCLQQGREPVVCLPPVGGQVSVYLRLLPLLSQRGVWALSDGASCGSVADRAKELAKLAPAGPLTLLGWSLGGVLAQAVAYELEQQGRQVRAVYMLDPAQPGVEVSGPGVALAALLHDEQPAAGSLARFQALASKFEAVGKLHEALAEAGLLPASLTNLSVFAERLEGYTEQLRALARHQPQTVAADLYLFWAGGASSYWDQLGGGVHHLTLNCDHYQMVSSEFLPQICRSL